MMVDSDTQMLMTPLDGKSMIEEAEQYNNSDIEEMIYGLALCLDLIYALEERPTRMRASMRL